ncbi:MAG: ComF family protein [Patescibacteria group bacterium]|nr:ComF family protein [Patescibacteria group bacterium]
MKKTFLCQIENSFLDLLFPIKCIGCGLEKKFICNDCLKKIPLKSLQNCPVCERAITLNGEVCKTCKNSSSFPLKGLFVASDYKDPLLSKAIHLYKYKFAHELVFSLGQILEKALSRHGGPAPDVIIPIPLHKRRLRWRGFNQAFLLAQHLSENLLPHMTIPIQNELVVRSRYAGSQMKVKDYTARFQNVSGAFQINDEANSFVLKKKNVLLVDDICTTGATLSECAKQLQKLHPKSISAIVLARQN